MDLSLTPEQEMLKAAARRFMAQEYPKEALLQIASPDETTPLEPWPQLASTGWLGILIPQEYGGEGGTFTDAGVLFEELGRGPAPGPHFASAALSALAILEGGDETQKRQWLPRIARGEMRLVPAITEPDYGWDEAGIRAAAAPNDDGGDAGRRQVNGVKAYVFDGQSATHFLCALRLAETGQVALAVIPAGAPGVQTRALPGFAWNLSEIRFDHAPINPDDLLPGGWSAWAKAAEKAIPVLCAFQVGGCQAVYELSVDYSRARIQFGTPIGRFQRVQDQIINLVNHLDAARWTTYEALWKLDAGRDAAASIRLAKAVASEGYYQACNYAHEVHAGVGSMTEYGLTLHTAASRTLYHYLGDPKQHKRELAAALGL